MAGAGPPPRQPLAPHHHRRHRHAQQLQVQPTQPPSVLPAWRKAHLGKCEGTGAAGKVAKEGVEGDGEEAQAQPQLHILGEEADAAEAGLRLPSVWNPSSVDRGRGTGEEGGRERRAPAILRRMS